MWSTVWSRQYPRLSGWSSALDSTAFGSNEGSRIIVAGGGGSGRDKESCRR
jgi:hypothetical protein